MEVDAALSDPPVEIPITPPIARRALSITGSTQKGATKGKNLTVRTMTHVSPKNMHPRLFEYKLEVITHDMAYLMNRPEPFRLAKDIPRRVQRFMNSVHSYNKKSRNAKHTFEAMILKNTTRDERKAPPIQIINNVDDEDSTPPWEFHYSNEMWYDEDIPPPDYDGVEGCGCDGVCDPTSATCACVKRQERWTNGPEEDLPIPGFAYDADGCLKADNHTYPIFECNWKCRCDEDCPNKVIHSPLLFDLDGGPENVFLGRPEWQEVYRQYCQNQTQRMG